MSTDRIETHQDWHPADTPEYLTAAIARVRAMFGLTPETAMIASHVQTAPDAPQAAQNAQEHTIMHPETLHSSPRLSEPHSASAFQCGTIRRAVDAAHDRDALLARFHRVTPVAVAMETATCPECGSHFQRRANQDHPRRYCTSRCYQRAYNRAGKALRQRAKQGWAA